MGKDSNAYDNDTEDEALVNRAECIDGIECEGVDGAPDEECIDGTEREGDKHAEVSGETSTETFFEYKYLFGEILANLRKDGPN